MASVKLKSISSEGAAINFHVNINNKDVSGYETDVMVTKNNDKEGWTASIRFAGMPVQETPEDALDRLGLYLISMAKYIKGKNIKHLNVGTLFDTTHKK